MASNTTNVLGHENVLKVMAQSLPKSNASANDKKALQDPFAAIALLSHACMLAVGFRLIGLGEDHKIEASSEPQAVQPLPNEWDNNSTYAFRYAHAQSSMEYLVKTNRLGSKAVIFGVALGGDDQTAQFEIKVQDYTSENSVKEVKQDSTDQSSTLQQLQNVFVSPARLTDLTSLFRINIIQRLAPGIAKEGYTETRTEDNASSSRSNNQDPRRDPAAQRPRPGYDPLRDDPQPPAAMPHPFNDPLAAEARHPRPVPDFAPPGFEDEHELRRPPRGGIPGMGGAPFGNIGERDLYPPGLGPHDPLRMRPGGGLRGGGGMHPTFDDPLFGGQGGGGGGGYNPAAPPGARYDPVGPGDGPPNLRQGGGRFPGRGGPGGGGFGGPPNPFSGYGSGDFI